jgi:hypothetical protein
MRSVDTLRRVLLGSCHPAPPVSLRPSSGAQRAEENIREAVRWCQIGPLCPGRGHASRPSAAHRPQHQGAARLCPPTLKASISTPPGPASRPTSRHAELPRRPSWRGGRSRRSGRTDAAIPIPRCRPPGQSPVHQPSRQFTPPQWAARSRPHGGPRHGPRGPAHRGHWPRRQQHTGCAHHGTRFVSYAVHLQRQVRRDIALYTRQMSHYSPSCRVASCGFTG